MIILIKNTELLHEHTDTRRAYWGVLLFPGFHLSPPSLTPLTSQLKFKGSFPAMWLSGSIIIDSPIRMDS